MLLNLTRVETAENRKLFKRLECELLQLNASFTTLSMETVMLISNKNFILTMLQLRDKISIL